jgi:C4-dicarboxylate-specific signal transduction histidine kinase
MVSSGHACQRWLTNEPPDLDAAGRAVGRMVLDARRAGEVISRIRALVKKSPARQDRLDVNDAVTDVISLVRSEIERNRVALKTKLAADLPAVLVDRVQLQQVILNLVINANEAMSTALDGPRELVITSGRGSENDVLLTVRDSGAGFDGTKLESIFEAFYTTKPDGMGIGLAVSRTIIQAHGGKLWAMPNEPRGAVFLFTLPACERGHDEASSGRSP